MEIQFKTISHIENIFKELRLRLYSLTYKANLIRNKYDNGEGMRDEGVVVRDTSLNNQMNYGYSSPEKFGQKGPSEGRKEGIE